MQQDYSVTKAPTTASTDGGSKNGTPNPWSNPNNIKVDDGNSAIWGAFEAAQSASITGGGFGFVIPAGAVIDGIQVAVHGSQTHCYGTVNLSIAGTTGKDIGALNGSFGNSTDLWGASSISVSSLSNLSVSVSVTDVSGAQGIASIDYLSVTVYYHIDLATAPAKVPTRIAYKVYSRAGRYLGELPNVSSDFAFPQDINSAGSSITVVCGKTIDQGVITSPLETEDGQTLQTENGQDLQATISTNVIARGDSNDEVIFKNSNRIKVWVYNYWYPNGKLEFSGQVNRVKFKYGGSDSTVQLTVLSDGLDLSNYIARGYPFQYTSDQAQTNYNASITIAEGGDKGGGWTRFGQSFKVGTGVKNVGAIALLVQGNADVTVSLYDAPNGNFIGQVTRTINDGGATVEQFNFPQLLNATAGSTMFFSLSLGVGQSLVLYYNNGSTSYTDGSLYESDYGGGSGGGSYYAIAGDLYFVTKYGTPTTSITFNSKDPIANMASDVLADYNSRGGYIKKRNFVATGLSLSYPFNMATVFDVIKKTLELAPTGYCAYVDLGAAKIDMFPISQTADFTVVRGKDINSLELELSIEQVQNDLLFTGGAIAKDSNNNDINLFKEYIDSQSASFYGSRYTSKTDNRVVVAATANAIGATFIQENSKETQETSLTIINNSANISLFTPGKTIGFRNFGNFIDNMVLAIVRREPNWSKGISVLTLGILPVRQSDEIQRINRDLLLEQTVNNPTAPS